MFCSKCGKEISDGASFCQSCGTPVKSDVTPSETSATSEAVLKANSLNTTQRKKWPTFFFCLFLGGLGIHRFYVGKIGTGILYLLTLGLFGVGVIVDLITILNGSFKDKAGQPLLTNESTGKVKKKVPGWQIAVGIVCGAFILIGLISIIGGSNEKTSVSETDSVKTVQTEKEKPKSPQDLLSEAVRNAVNDQLISLKINKGDSPNTDIASIYVKATDNLTTNMIKRGMLIDSKEIFKNIYTNPKLDNFAGIVIFFYFPLTDIYGNSKDEVVMKLGMTRETAQKINWEGLLTDNVDKVVDQYWYHPALDK